jgi:hypothetical protein
MHFMLSWKITPETCTGAAKQFIETSGVDVGGITTIGQWYAPRSSYGWYLVEGAPKAAAK